MIAAIMMIVPTPMLVVEVVVWAAAIMNVDEKRKSLSICYLI